MAAVVALATVAGAARRRAGDRGSRHLRPAIDAERAANNSPLEASVARIDADMLALKASVEQTSKTGMSQFNKTSDRLDKVEKAQAEPAAKLAKLSEAVDKLRAPQPAARRAGLRQRRSQPAAAKDVTGSITPPAATRPLQPPPPSVAAPRPRSAGCRRSKAGCCATSSTAVR